MFETQKSRNKKSSGEIGLNIRLLASPEVGQDQVSGGVSILCWHAAPVANVLWKSMETYFSGPTAKPLATNQQTTANFYPVTIHTVVSACDMNILSPSLMATMVDVFRDDSLKLEKNPCSV